MSTPLVSDALWSLIAPFLPPERPKPRGGRPRSITDRAALSDILFILKSGVGWEMLPQDLGCGSGTTCWRRLRDCQRAGVWQGVHRALLQQLQVLGRSRGNGPHWIVQACWLLQEAKQPAKILARAHDYWQRWLQAHPAAANLGQVDQEDEAEGESEEGAEDCVVTLADLPRGTPPDNREIAERNTPRLHAAIAQWAGSFSRSFEWAITPWLTAST